MTMTEQTFVEVTRYIKSFSSGFDFGCRNIGIFMEEVYLNIHK
jgi:hypothetical protein